MNFRKFPVEAEGMQSRGTTMLGGTLQMGEELHGAPIKKKQVFAVSEFAQNFSKTMMFHAKTENMLMQKHLMFAESGLMELSNHLS